MTGSINADTATTTIDAMKLMRFCASNDYLKMVIKELPMLNLLL